MLSSSDILPTFILLWTVIDPIGTIPVYFTKSKHLSAENKRLLATKSVGAAATILIFFLVAGQYFLAKMGIPLTAFQISSGIILFMFSLTMVFGDGKPEEEIEMCASAKNVSIFPLAMPSIASPGAIMAVMLLTDNRTHSLSSQVTTAVIMGLILVITWGMMLCAPTLQRIIGTNGANIISRIMGLILSALAAFYVVDGIRMFFNLG